MTKRQLTCSSSGVYANMQVRVMVMCLCSPLWKQAGRTDVNKSVQSMFEQASKQSARVAESLRDAASRGSNPEGILRNGQQMLSKTLKDGEHLFNQTARGDGPVQQGLQQV